MRLSGVNRQIQVVSAPKIHVCFLMHNAKTFFVLQDFMPKTHARSGTVHLPSEKKEQYVHCVAAIGDDRKAAGSEMQKQRRCMHA